LRDYAVPFDLDEDPQFWSVLRRRDGGEPALPTEVEVSAIRARAHQALNAI
jgi:hypothetical protein